MGQSVLGQHSRNLEHRGCTPRVQPAPACHQMSPPGRAGAWSCLQHRKNPTKHSQVGTIRAFLLNKSHGTASPMEREKSTHCWAGLGLCHGRGVTEVPGWAWLAKPFSLRAGIVPEAAWHAGEGKGESSPWRAQVASWAIPCLGTQHTLRLGSLLSTGEGSVQL